MEHIKKYWWVYVLIIIILIVALYKNWDKWFAYNHKPVDGTNCTTTLGEAGFYTNGVCVTVGRPSGGGPGGNGGVGGGGDTSTQRSINCQPRKTIVTPKGNVIADCVRQYKDSSGQGWQLISSSNKECCYKKI